MNLSRRVFFAFFYFLLFSECAQRTRALEQTCEGAAVMAAAPVTSRDTGRLHVQWAQIIGSGHSLNQEHCSQLELASQEVTVLSEEAHDQSSPHTNTDHRAPEQVCGRIC